MSLPFVTGSKRGRGACQNCRKEYFNRSKPKVCDCGANLNGKFTPKICMKEPAAVVVYNIPESGKLISVKITQRGERRFCFISTKYESICYANKCLQHRALMKAIGKVLDFKCVHFDYILTAPIYIIEKFEPDEIKRFTPNSIIQKEMIDVQVEGLPAVIKSSRKVFIVIGWASRGSPMRYTHVMIHKGTDQKVELFCCNLECQSGRKSITKQVSGSHLCIHQHFVLLAQSLKENKGNDHTKVLSDETKSIHVSVKKEVNEEANESSPIEKVYIETNNSDIYVKREVHEETSASSLTEIVYIDEKNNSESFMKREVYEKSSVSSSTEKDYIDETNNNEIYVRREAHEEASASSSIEIVYIDEKKDSEINVKKEIHEENLVPSLTENAINTVTNVNKVNVIKQRLKMDRLRTYCITPR